MVVEEASTTFSQSGSFSLGVSRVLGLAPTVIDANVLVTGLITTVGDVVDFVLSIPEGSAVTVQVDTRTQGQIRIDVDLLDASQSIISGAGFYDDNVVSVSALSVGGNTTVRARGYGSGATSPTGVDDVGYFALTVWVTDGLGIVIQRLSADAHAPPYIHSEPVPGFSCVFALNTTRVTEFARVVFTGSGDFALYPPRMQVFRTTLGALGTSTPICNEKRGGNITFLLQMKTLMMERSFCWLCQSHRRWQGRDRTNCASKTCHRRPSCCRLRWGIPLRAQISFWTVTMVSPPPLILTMSQSRTRLWERRLLGVPK